MTRVVHTRVREIVTVTATCDRCGESQCVAPETLQSRGWASTSAGDFCPSCHGTDVDGRRRAEEQAARDRYLRELEAGEPPLVHGRVFVEVHHTGWGCYGCHAKHGELHAPRCSLGEREPLTSRGVRAVVYGERGPGG